MARRERKKKVLRDILGRGRLVPSAPGFDEPAGIANLAASDESGLPPRSLPHTGDHRLSRRHTRRLIAFSARPRAAMIVNHTEPIGAMFRWNCDS